MLFSRGAIMRKATMRMVLCLCAVWSLCGAAAFAETYPGTPEGVMAGYLKADGDGMGLSSDTCQEIFQYAVWPEAPGWDTFSVIRSFEIQKTSPTKDGVNIKVEYLLAGEMRGEEFVPRNKKEGVTYKLVQEAGKWKVAEPQLQPHVLLEKAVAFVKIPEAQRALENAAAGKRKSDEVKE